MFDALSKTIQKAIYLLSGLEKYSTCSIGWVPLLELCGKVP